MNKYIYISLLISIPFFSSCDLEKKAKREYERIKNQYEEAHSERGERPFDIVYQPNEDAKTAIISSKCTENNDVEYVYYQHPTDSHNNYFHDTKNLLSYPEKKQLKPFWDVRYMNPMNKYIYHTYSPQYANHSELTGLDARSGKENMVVGTSASEKDIGGGIIQSKCVDNTIVAGTTISLWDAPSQNLTYGGLASTFTYRVDKSNIHPWKSNKTGNLVLQAFFKKPLYRNYENNIGGGVSFNFFIYNAKINKTLNFVIGIYAYGGAWIKENAGIKYDPTTNIVHVSSVIKNSSWWSTISPKSQSIQEITSNHKKKTSDDGRWNNFFRVNVSYQNLLAVLNELKTNPPPEVTGEDFELHPEDWKINTIMLQYELDEDGGKATISGSFSGFEVYLSKNPL